MRGRIGQELPRTGVAAYRAAWLCTCSPIAAQGVAPLNLIVACVNLILFVMKLRIGLDFDAAMVFRFEIFDG